MRNEWKRRWGWRVSAVVLTGGLLVLGTGTVVTQAGDRDDDHNKRNPFQRILDKLDDILDAVKGGGGQDGNHTLRWDTNHPSATRFTTAFPGAVLDKNTGLVWEQAPDRNFQQPWQTLTDGSGASTRCLNKTVGGTGGWRLPSVVELRSVLDPTLPAPFVPGGVFTGVFKGFYWTATTVADFPHLVWYVDLENGSTLSANKLSSLLAWCVRGGMNADAY